MQLFLASLLLILPYLSSSHKCLPKNGSLPMSDIYSCNIARSGKDSFWKVDGNGWSTIISQYPVRQNATTKVTFYLQNGRNFMFGCGKKYPEKLCSNHVGGHIPDSVAYYTHNGQKYRGTDPVDYSSNAVEGDNITMIINLKEYENNLSFEKNGHSMGIAYSGLNDWDQIYIMASGHYAGHRIKIIDYHVQE